MNAHKYCQLPSSQWAEGGRVFFILQLDMVRLGGKGKGGHSGAPLSVS